MYQFIFWYQYNINIMNEGKIFVIVELVIKLYCSDLYIVEFLLIWLIKDMNKQI